MHACMTYLQGKLPPPPDEVATGTRFNASVLTVIISFFEGVDGQDVRYFTPVTNIHNMADAQVADTPVAGTLFELAAGALWEAEIPLPRSATTIGHLMHATGLNVYDIRIIGMRRTDGRKVSAWDILSRIHRVMRS